MAADDAASASFIFAAACLVVGASAAFAPAPLGASFSSFSSHASFASPRTTRPRPLLPMASARRTSPTPLRSSLEEALSTGITNSTGGFEFEQARILSGGELGDLPISGGISGGIGDVPPPQGLQEVLASPELLDPAAVLDATIGTIDLTADALDGPAGGSDLASYATTVAPAAEEGAPAHEGFDLIQTDGDAAAAVGDATSPTMEIVPSAKALSKEEDLELTLQAIMRHIEKDAAKDGVVDDDDETEDVDLVTKLATSTDTPQQLGLEETAVTTTAVKKSVLENVPTVSKILRFTIPAIGIWLCSPVLSMIDTAAVGLLSGTAQQAALNPAVSVTDYGALVVAFMYTATTNLISAAVQEDKEDHGGKEGALRQPKTTTTLITSLKLALGVGSVFGLAMGSLAPTLLRLLIGNDSLDPAVFAAALRYVRIRSLGMPAAVVMGTAQSACLGMRDVRSPLYVLAAAAVVNFLGDVMMVPSKSVLFGGAAGAAWATVASQYAALTFFARWLTSTPSNGEAVNGDRSKRRRDIFRRSLPPWFGGKRDKSNEHGRLHFLWRDGKMHHKGIVNEEEMKVAVEGSEVVDVTKGIMELTGTSKAGKTRRKEFRKFLASSKLSRRVRRASAAAEVHYHHRSPAEVKAPTRGFLSNSKMTPRSFLSFSGDNFNITKAREFLPFVIPVTTTSVGRISGYIAMSHVASSTLGTYDMAGHQIVFSIFCCLTPFVDALSQVAQSFVPAVFESKDRSKERALALRRTVNNFRKVGAGFGACLVGMVSCIPLISRYFSTDPIVLGRVNSAIPGVGLFMVINGLMCSGEGSLLGQKDLAFLRNMYALFFFTVPAYMLRLKYRALAGTQTVTIGTMWAAFSTYNVIRTSIWQLRLAQLQRRTDRGVEGASAEP